MAIKDGIPLGTALPPPERPPETLPRAYELLRRSIQQLLQGRSNAVGAVEIVAGDSPLTVLDPRCAATAVILIMIETSDLANNLVFFISAVNNGSFVLEFTHSGQLPTTTIRYLIQG